MKKPGFFEGVIVALIISVSASVAYMILSSLLGGGWLLRILVAAMGLAYVIYLLSRSKERVGKITVTASWIAGAAIIWLLAPTFVLYVLLHVGMIWLIRSLYYYTSVLSSLADFGLNAISVVIAFWAGLHSHSLFLSLWCFFLTQALFVLIPVSLQSSLKPSAKYTSSEDRFEKAYRNAESAVRKLSASH